MRVRSIFVFLILVLGLIGLNLALGQVIEEEHWDRDNFGKVIGQIIDADTGEPVRDYFIVVFSPHNEWRPVTKNKAGTDKTGRFVKNQKPGTYVLSCSPHDNKKYAFDHNPFIFTETLQKITVEKGKITKVFKKAYRAGTMKIIIVDANGSQFNPRDFLGEGEIYGDTRYILTPSGEKTGTYPSMNSYLWDPEKAEIYQYNLYPGIYSGGIDFHYKNLGYPDQKIDNILIEKGRTTVVKIVMDLNDNTGVFGKITDLNGNPVEKVKAYVSSIEKIEGFEIGVMTYTNSNGDYKIIGLSEGRYNLNFSKEFGPTYTSFDIPSEEIFIKKGVTIERNRKIKTL